MTVRENESMEEKIGRNWRQVGTKTHNEKAFRHLEEICGLAPTKT